MKKHSTPSNSTLFESLENQGVETAYITLLRNLYNGATSTLKLHRDSDKIKLQTKVMLNESATTSTVAIDGNTIEKVDRYVYLGKTVTQAGDLLPEIKRRCHELPGEANRTSKRKRGDMRNKEYMEAIKEQTQNG